MSLIAADIEKPPATVFAYLLYNGGIEPRTRSRRPDALSFDDRELISRSLARGDSMRSIAKDLNRAASSISQDIARNGGVNRYRATLAEKAFLKRADLSCDFRSLEHPGHKLLPKQIRKQRKFKANSFRSNL